MTSIKMLLSYNNNEKIVQLPVVPDNLPEILQELDNSSITTHTKTLTLLGNKKPRSFSLSLFLPTRDYEFCKGNGEEVIELLKHVTDTKIPARLVIVDRLTELLNIAIAIKIYKYYYDTAKNIRATIDCVEYEFLTTVDTGGSSEEETPEFSTLIVRYRDKTAAVKAANIQGHNLVKARDVLILLEKVVGWNANRKQVTADTQLLDIHTEIYEGIAYCYIRDIAAELGIEVEYNAADKSVTLKDGD